jgi:hypothetical protein
MAEPLIEHKIVRYRREIRVRFPESAKSASWWSKA